MLIPAPPDHAPRDVHENHAAAGGEVTLGWAIRRERYGANGLAWPMAKHIRFARQRLARGEQLIGPLAAFFGLPLPLVVAGPRRSVASKMGRIRSGTSLAQRAHAQQYTQAMLARRRSRFAKTCGRGHRWTKENTYYGVRKTGPQAGQRTRICKACQRISEGRRRWQRRVVAAKMTQLRKAIIDAHPDRGGTAAKFREARQKYLSAMRKVA